jgi:hypothetical protein
MYDVGHTLKKRFRESTTKQAMSWKAPRENKKWETYKYMECELVVQKMKVMERTHLDRAAWRHMAAGLCLHEA